MPHTIPMEVSSIRPGWHLCKVPSGGAEQGTLGNGGMGSGWPWHPPAPPRMVVSMVRPHVLDMYRSHSNLGVCVHRWGVGPTEQPIPTRAPQVRAASPMFTRNTDDGHEHQAKWTPAESHSRDSTRSKVGGGEREEPGQEGRARATSAGQAGPLSSLC